MPPELKHVPEDKKIELDVEVKTAIVDSLLLLAATRKARDDMRDKQVVSTSYNNSNSAPSILYCVISMRKKKMMT
jgi:hypothetical protein